MVSRIRIDRLLVERGLFESRAKAQAAIAAGCVTADDVVVGKPSEEIPAPRSCGPSPPTLTCRAAG
jgi:23S rRNA (cytidine1920-2'-O)/16S rRNA (cytidine1409-2'-O)-methyltransferase